MQTKIDIKIIAQVCKLIDETAAEIKDLLRTGVLAEPLSVLQLSTRTWNCLNNGNIQTLDQLVLWTPKRLMKLRNFGKLSLNEIREQLALLGLVLSE